MSKKSIQARLPEAMNEIVERIKTHRKKNMEPFTTKAIIIDALKEMDAKIESA